MVRHVNKRDIDDICHQIGFETFYKIKPIGTKKSWINLDRAELIQISDVIKEFAKLGWIEPTLRYDTYKQRNIGIYLLNRDFDSVERRCKEIQWLNIKPGFSDVTFNPSEQEPTIAGFCRKCCYCLLLPYTLRQRPELDEMAWRKKIESLGGKMGLVGGAPLLLLGWDKPDLNIVRTLKSNIQKLRDDTNLCEYENALDLLITVSNAVRRRL